MALETVYDATVGTATDEGSTVNVPSIKGNPTGLWQVKNSGTATVALQGRLIDDDAECDWEEIYSFASTGGVRQVALFPFMRVAITGASGSPVVKSYLHL